MFYTLLMKNGKILQGQKVSNRVKYWKIVQVFFYRRFSTTPKAKKIKLLKFLKKDVVQKVSNRATIFHQLALLETFWTCTFSIFHQKRVRRLFKKQITKLDLFSKK